MARSRVGRGVIPAARISDTSAPTVLPIMATAGRTRQTMKRPVPTCQNLRRLVLHTILSQFWTQYQPRKSNVLRFSPRLLTRRRPSPDRTIDQVARLKEGIYHI